jgi:hypothetical protein
MSDSTSSYATAGIALRVSGALKPHHHDKVETPSVGELGACYAVNSLGQGSVNRGATVVSRARSRMSIVLFTRHVVLLELGLQQRHQACPSVTTSIAITLCVSERPNLQPALF